MYYWEGVTDGLPIIQDIMGLYDDEDKFRKDFFRMARWREEQSKEEEALFKAYSYRRTDQILSGDWKYWLEEYLELPSHAGYSFQKMRKNEVVIN